MAGRVSPNGCALRAVGARSGTAGALRGSLHRELASHFQAARRGSGGESVMSNSSSAKKPNVYYVEANGVELPVVDVTNPEFALSVGPAEQREMVAAYARRQRPYRFMPRWLRRWMFQSMTKRSILARALSTKGRYLGGLDTYLFKLGPDNLGTVTTDVID